MASNKPLTNDDFQPGDILAFSGRDIVSRVIKAATCPPWYWFRSHWRAVSHVGIVVKLPAYESVLLVESTTLTDRPCFVSGKRTSGVQAHRPELAAMTYPGFVYRLRLHPDYAFDEYGAGELAKFAAARIGKPYDLKGAVRSATPFARGADDSSTFCSEFVVAALRVSGRGRYPVVNPQGVTPAKLLKTVVHIGTYQQPERIR